MANICDAIRSASFAFSGVGFAWPGNWHSNAISICTPCAFGIEDDSQHHVYEFCVAESHVDLALGGDGLGRGHYVACSETAR